jgi:hypothetical protein
MPSARVSCSELPNYVSSDLGFQRCLKILHAYLEMFYARHPQCRQLKFECLTARPVLIKLNVDVFDAVCLFMSLIINIGK